jgi:sugar/nucleoside kinase (ribokinase family)
MDVDRRDAARVLVVGDLNPDLVLRGDVVPRFGQAEQLLEQATLLIGGSAGITAHGFARLGRPVSLVAAVGADVFGRQVCAELAAAGVDVEPVLRRGEQSTGLTVVLSRSDDRAILTLPGAIASLTADEVRTAADRLGRSLAHVHISALFLQPALAETLAGVLAEFRARGLTTSLDTNDDPAGRWIGLDPLLPHLDMLLPNTSEVVSLARETDPHRAAAMLAARGPLVVVKDGARGAFAVGPHDELVELPAVPTVSVDTTGAGDTFDAAFVDSRLHGLDVAGSLASALVAGARAVGAVGGTAGQPRREELNSWKDLTHR